MKTNQGNKRTGWRLLLANLQRRPAPALWEFLLFPFVIARWLFVRVIFAGLNRFATTMSCGFGWFFHQMQNPEHLFNFLLVVTSVISVGLGAKSLLAANESISVARAGQQAESRAYIGYENMRHVVSEVDNRDLKRGDPGYFFRNRITITLKNNGDTPAVNVGGTINYAATEFGYFLPMDFAFADQAADPKMNRITGPVTSVMLDRNQTLDVSRSLSDTEAEKLIHAAEKREIYLFFYGHIDYCDIYGRQWSRYYANFYNVIDPQMPKFVPVGNHQGEREIGKC